MSFLYFVFYNVGIFVVARVINFPSFQSSTTLSYVADIAIGAINLVNKVMFMFFQNLIFHVKDRAKLSCPIGDSSFHWMTFKTIVNFSGN